MWYDKALVAYLSYAQTFVDLYQASIKEKGKEIEMNFTNRNVVDKRYFLDLTLTNANVSTIFGTVNLIECSGIANIVLPNETRFHINDALYYSKSTRNSLSFKDIRRNGYHIETMNEGNIECLYITSIVYGKKFIMEKLSAYSFGLYHTNIKYIESYVVVNKKFNDPKTFSLWHNRLGHLGSSMMRRTHKHPLKNQKIPLPHGYPCAACLQGKLLVKPSFSKVTLESTIFLERIHRDICEPIHSPYGHFHYFMVLIDASTRWSHVFFFPHEMLPLLDFWHKLSNYEPKFLIT